MPPKGREGGKGYRGHEVASTLRREAPLREPGVPPNIQESFFQKKFSKLLYLIPSLKEGLKGIEATSWPQPYVAKRR